MSDIIPEQKNEVRVYEVVGFCPECSKKPNGGCLLEQKPEVILIYPALYVYMCTSCRKEFKSEKKYPRIEYQYIGER